jgi:hypothetical protein
VIQIPTPSFERHVVTVGDQVGAAYGYGNGTDSNNPAFGGMSTSTFRGATIRWFFSNTFGGGRSLRVNLLGSRAQDFFKEVVVQATASGPYRRFTTYNVPEFGASGDGLGTVWGWDPGAATPIWIAGDIGTSREIIFLYS